MWDARDDWLDYGRLRCLSYYAGIKASGDLPVENLRFDTAISEGQVCVTLGEEQACADRICVR